MQYIVVCFFAGRWMERKKAFPDTLFHAFFCKFAPAHCRRRPKGGRRACAVYRREDVYRRLAFEFQNFATSKPIGGQMATSSVLVVCISTPLLPAGAGRRVRHIHIGVGFLRCPFLVGGHAKALELGADKGKIPAPFPYVCCSGIITRPAGNPGRKGGEGQCATSGTLSAARSVSRGARSLGLQDNCVAPAPMCTRYSPRRTSTWLCCGASPASSGTISSTTFRKASPATSISWPDPSSALFPKRHYSCH